MSVRQVKGNKVTKDGRSWTFYIREIGLDGKKHVYESQKFLTKEEAIKAEEEYLNKYKDIDVNPHLTFKEAYTKYYEYQSDKVKDTTLKTYRDRARYMKISDDVELVKFRWWTFIINGD